MFKNYFKIALRNLRRNKLYSFINISGLMVGIAVCLLVVLFVRNELSYDRFNTKTGQIYRMVWKAKFGENEWQIPLVGPPLAQAMKNNLPGVEQVASLMPGQLVIENNGNYIKQDNVFYTSDQFFDVFTVHFVEGNPRNALREPNSVVLTQSTAKKYFADRNPLGKTLRLNDGRLLNVTGVVDGFPPQSHFHFDILRRLKDSERYNQRKDAWGDATVYTYVLLKKGTNLGKLNSELRKFVNNNVAGGVFSRPGNYTSYLFQPLTSIHLHSHMEYELEPNGNITYIYIVIIIALFVLIIACVNFLNLATARSMERLKEIGIRKVLGSQKKQLIYQFFMETFLHVMVAVFLALGVVALLLPYINSFTHRYLTYAGLLNPVIILLVTAGALLVTFISGAYPAFYVSSFNPIPILHKQLQTKPNRKIFRKPLVVFQFFISISIIACTLVLFRQIGYIKNRDLGFDKEHVLVVKNLGSLGRQYGAFRDQLESQSAVVDATATQSLPGDEFDSTIFLPEQPSNYKETSLTYDMVDKNFVKVLKLKLVEGRNFSPDSFPSDSSAYLINQAAAEKLGWRNPVGKHLTMAGKRGQIIGVVKNFNYQSLKHAIQPVVFPYIRWEPGIMAIRLRPGNVTKGIDAVKNIWKKFAPNRPFEFTFLSQDFQKLYESEERLSGVFTVLSLLAIFIACFGLFGLSSYTVQQRTKEIGVRKVFGASVHRIVVLLMRDFLVPVVIAGIIAIPVTYYAMNRWLQTFAYHTGIGVWVFVLSIMASLVIAFITIGYRTIKAALMNPVESLRNE